MTTKRTKVQRDRPRGSASFRSPAVRKKSAEAAAESRFVPERSTLRVVAIAAMIFVVAHLALVFGSLAIVAMYLCGVALFAAQGPALATALPTVFNQMVFVQSRIAMLDICALTFALLGIAAFMHGFRKQRPDRQKRITTTSEISHSPDVTRTSQIGTNDPVRTCGLRLGEVRAQKDGFTTLRAILLLVSA